MLHNQDIRWIQRFNNFSKALIQLENGVLLSKQRELSELEKQGIIQSFEFVHELAWNVMKDYFEYQGSAGHITGSRDATKESFQKGLIIDGQDWMDMIASRNKTFHTYNQEIANEIYHKIAQTYFPLFQQFKSTMKELVKKLAE